MFRLAMAATLALLPGASQGFANEFWISPEVYRLPSGESVLADLLVGEEFRGAAQGFAPRTFNRFEILAGENVVSVEGRPGDVPAMNATDLPEGLAVIVHETAARDLTWNDWDEFAAFAETKGLGDVLAMHAERGLDRATVREEYIRFAKSLVAVGHGRGEDRMTGMRTELVALANPYTDDLAGAMPVQLWLDGEPRRIARVEVFSRTIGGDDAELSVFETDGNGIVVLPVQRGMEYLVNAVTLEAVENEGENGGPAEEGTPDWRTLWASLTFSVPVPETTP